MKTRTFPTFQLLPFRLPNHPYQIAFYDAFLSHGGLKKFKWKVTLGASWPTPKQIRYLKTMQKILAQK